MDKQKTMLTDTGVMSSWVDQITWWALLLLISVAVFLLSGLYRSRKHD